MVTRSGVQFGELDHVGSPFAAYAVFSSRVIWLSNGEIFASFLPFFRVTEGMSCKILKIT